jgi:hypothetical protein
MLMLLSVASCAMAVYLGYLALAPDRLHSTPTMTLLIILGLLILPALTAGAWGWDLSVCYRTRGLSSGVGETGRTVEHPPGRVLPHRPASGPLGRVLLPPAAGVDAGLADDLEEPSALLVRQVDKRHAERRAAQG